jgi:hypothetical protein
MGKAKTEQIKINKIINLRSTGHSYKEIQKSVGCGFGTVFRYAKEVKIKPRYEERLLNRQRQSVIKSEIEWKKARLQVKKLFKKITKKEKLLILAMLYWGEGTKAELNIMNGDPRLLKVFLTCLKELGVKDDELVFSLRIFGLKSKTKSLKYWSKGLDVSKAKVQIGEVILGSDSDRLPHGMCRVRVKKGAKYFKLIMSMIECLPELI